MSTVSQQCAIDLTVHCVHTTQILLASDTSCMDWMMQEPATTKKERKLMLAQQIHPALDLEPPVTG